MPGVQHEQNADVLHVANLTVRYNSTNALENISFQLTRGERLAVVGPNGAGKSTLFKVIAGLLPSTSGTVNVYGHAPGGHICIAYVPQRNQVAWDFPVNVYDVVMMGRTSKIGLLRLPRRSDHAMVSRCLELVGMEQYTKRQINELSGGQQQRVFIARALAQEAELMLMDEPLTGLDVTSQAEIFRILDLLREKQVTVMVSTHDLNQAAEYFDRVMLINHQLLGIGLAQDVFHIKNLTAVYGGHVRVLDNNDPSSQTVLVDTCCHDRAE